MIQSDIATKQSWLSRFYAIWAGLETILAFFRPDPRHLMTMNAVRRHGGFDKDHYRPQIPGHHLLYHLFPLRHYAILGEPLGLSPNMDFCPETYLRLNPDVANAGVPPLWHWLTKGQGECRRTQEQLKSLPLPQDLAGPLRLRARPARQSLAVHIHVHYPELWPEMVQAVRESGLKMDVFVTLSYQGSKTRALQRRIQTDLPEAEVHILENRGRDILPFVTLLNAGAFDGYQAVCKLHTKRSAHRVDGNRWRRRLISGALPPDARRLLRRFLADPDLAIWVADGQLLTDRKWWGENRAKTATLLNRIELGSLADRPYFPAGSMYWIKPFTLGLLRSLRLGAADFEDETGALDGTTAHAVERIVGELGRAAGQRVIETARLRKHRPKPRMAPTYVSAFYLPQFHRIPENDRWWGNGYTEWQAVKAARPLYRDHLLPKPAAPLGAYDLARVETMEKQAHLAEKAGVNAFCVYYYWFGDQKLLERPLDQVLARPDIKFPFYLCWANESWRRNWDGLSGEILVHQRYDPGFEMRIAQDAAVYMRDPRYQRPDGTRPRFVIYRPADLPNPAANIAALRKAWRSLGIGEVELGAVRFHLGDDLPQDCVDFWIEMPPHGLFQPKDGLPPDQRPTDMHPRFAGLIYAYKNLIARAGDPSYRAGLPRNTIRGAMPSWDNTARRQHAAHIAFGATPAGFRRWLRVLADDGIRNSYRQEVMINAWNEWGEKAMLEPDDRFGDLNLLAVKEMVDAG